MPPAADFPPAALLPRLRHFAEEETKPFPGRARDALRITVAVVATLIASEVLRVPFPDYSAYLVFFVASRNGTLSLRLGAAAMAGVTVALALAIGIAICFGDAPWLRVPVTLALIGGAIWLSRVLVLQVMGRLLAVMLALCMSIADVIPDAQRLTTSILWLWSVAALPIGLSLVVNWLIPDRSGAAPVSSPPHGGPLVSDALTNPEYLRFTVRGVVALAACEVFMQAVNWTGIRTSMVTVAVTALATQEARLHKQALRFSGACLGGALGLGAVLFLVPNMDSIVSLSLVVAAATFAFAWVSVGSPRSSYAGFQMALAFYILLLPGFDTSIDLTQIRDRFIGILVGIGAVWLFIDLPERGSDRS